METKKSTSKRQTVGPRPSHGPFNQDQVNERIRKVAQGLYEQRGRTPGHELEDWLQAERRVKKELQLT